MTAADEASAGILPRPAGPGTAPADTLTEAREANTLLGELLDAPGHQRDALLQARCAGRPALQALVQRLLARAQVEDPELLPGAPLLHDIDPALLQAEPALAPGTRIHRYTLQRELGRGGMSIVYLAEQQSDGFSQLVALKRMRASAEHPSLSPRFARERRILALLRHPDIARILDVGSDGEQRPYIVMEYVDGQAIDRYCDEHRLALRARMERFVQVAAAVAFAHTNLVVHRDIKPGNVLVDRHGRAKLLDFGIAKLLDGSDSDLTATAHGPQTPAWASPEQVQGLPVTTASDVYQLGLLLHVLLAGVLPYETAGRAPHAIAADIANGRFATLSRRLASLPEDAAQQIARQRRMSSAATLQRALRGDADLIVARALATDPERRYASAGHLLDDVQRHLQGRPIAARPDHFGYRFSRLVARHRIASALAATLLLSLLAGGVALSLQALRLRDAVALAEQEAATSTAVLDYLLAVFQMADPQRVRGNQLTVREALDSGSDALQGRFAGRADIELRVRSALGQVYESLGELDQALQHYQRAAALAAGLPAVQRARAALATDALLARVYIRLGRYEAADGLLQGLLAAVAQGRGDARLRLDSMGNLAGVRMALGDMDGAIAMSRDALALRRDMDGDSHAHTLRAANNHAALLMAGSTEPSAAHMAESLALMDTVVAQAPAVLGADHPAALEYRLHRAKLLSDSGRHADAVAVYREALPALAEVLPDSHPSRLNSQRHYGMALLRGGDAAGAWGELAAAASGMDQALGTRHPLTLAARLDLAHAALLRGDEEQALAALRQALDGGLDPQRIASHPVLARLQHAAALQ